MSENVPGKMAKKSNSTSNWSLNGLASGKDFRRTINAVSGFLVVIFAAFWTIALIDRILMPLIVAGGVEIDVPDLREMPISLAQRVCAAKGIELVRGERMRMDSRHKPGTVVDQFPVAGSKVKSGRRIEVVLSIREQLLLCPDVLGRSPREAMLVADSTGIVVKKENISCQHSDTLPEGVIMSQRPLPRERIPRNSELNLTVSLGQKPDKIVAPELIGRHFSEIDLLLAKYDLSLGQISRYPQKSTREGIIIEQTPKSGTAMVSGQRIDVKIAVSPSN